MKRDSQCKKEIEVLPNVWRKDSWCQEAVQNYKRFYTLSFDVLFLFLCQFDFLTVFFVFFLLECIHLGFCSPRFSISISCWLSIFLSVLLLCSRRVKHFNSMEILQWKCVFLSYLSEMQSSPRNKNRDNAKLEIHK